MCFGGGSNTTLPDHEGSVTFNSVPGQPDQRKRQAATKPVRQPQTATQLTSGTGE